jgi:hydrogenase maturation protease
MGLRIIGCGTFDRGDDAAGLLVARRLQALGVEAVEQSGESASLMDCWSGFEHVVLVDATAPGGRPGHTSVWNAHAGKLPKDVLACSTHAFGVREAVELARAMNRLPENFFIYCIEGKQFSVGSPLSPEVEHAVGSVAQQLLELTHQSRVGHDHG